LGVACVTPASGNNRLPAPRPRSRNAAAARQVWCPDEMCAYTQLSPDRIDEFRDLMIFS